MGHKFLASESFDMLAHFYCLMWLELSTLTPGERMLWNGELLCKELKGLNGFMQPFFPPGHWHKAGISRVKDCAAKFLPTENEML